MNTATHMVLQENLYSTVRLYCIKEPYCISIATAVVIYSIVNCNYCCWKLGNKTTEAAQGASYLLACLCKHLIDIAGDR